MIMVVNARATLRLRLRLRLRVRAAIGCTIAWTVVVGDRRGRTLGFPTANMCTENELLPPHGVYATTATWRGVVRASVTNIGVRPTVDDTGRATVETHVFDFAGELYGESIRLGFVQRLRDERAFESLAALTTQIDADCQRARMLFDRLSL